MEMSVFEKLEQIGVVPVVVLENADDAVSTARALAAGGLATAEITFRTDAAAEAIRRITQEEPEVLVGAGTVLTVENARRAAEAGARYVVSPGLNPKVVGWCLEHGMPVVPGVATPTEVEAAMELGLTHLKLFPASVVGGPAMLKALASPYRGVRFMATGGVSAENMADYFACKNLFAVGGGWLTGSRIAAGDWQGITAAAADAAARLARIRG